jgi:hypothetical protein
LADFKQKINFILNGRIVACPSEDREYVMFYKALKFEITPKLLLRDPFVELFNNALSLELETDDDYGDIKIYFQKGEGDSNTTKFVFCFHPDKFKDEFKELGQKINKKLNLLSDYLTNGLRRNSEELKDDIIDEIMAIPVVAPPPPPAAPPPPPAAPPPPPAAPPPPPASSKELSFEQAILQITTDIRNYQLDRRNMPQAEREDGFKKLIRRVTNLRHVNAQQKTRKKKLITELNAIAATPIGSSRNHTTRKHWMRSKPSRFTRHRIY